MACQLTSNVLIILFNGFNTLDVNGPYEVLRKSGTSDIFKVTTASETEITTSIEGVHIKRDIPIDDHLFASLSHYDLLVIPGGFATTPDSPVQKLADDLNNPFMKVIEKFAKIPTTKGHYPRILLSVCTGAIFCGSAGIFNGGLFCTTHWGAYEILKEYNSRAATSDISGTTPGVVVKARYVDSGLNSKGVRIISSGGISCGMDASLHVVTLRKDEQEAIDTANLLDYTWRKTEGVIFGQ